MVKLGFFSRTQNTILSAAFILAFAYGASAVLGLVRSRLMATFFGDSLELSVFYLADRIPSLTYTILAVGALATVFIPVFAEELEKDQDKAFNAASNILTLCLLVFLACSALIVVFAPQIIDVISAGQLTGDQIKLGASLMRLMLVSQMLLVVSSFLGCVLQSFKYFLVPALAPVLYNLGLIFGLIFLVGRFGIYAPALGGILGAVFHLGLQALFVGTTGFVYRFQLDLANPALRRMLVLLPPRLLSLTMGQLTLIVNNALAILVSAASVIYLKFADQLQSFPVNFFGASIAFAALPLLCLESAGENLESFKKTFYNSFFQMMYLALPASVILIILRVPVTRLVYGASAFPWDATLQTALLLGIFSVSIFAQGAVLLLNRTFYAFKDTLTPLLVSLVSMTVTLATSFTAIRLLGLGVWTIAAAISLGSFMDCFLLLTLVQKRIGRFTAHEFLIPFGKIVLSALAMGISIYGPLKLLDVRVFDTTKTVELMILTAVVITSGMVSYLFFTRLFKVKEVELFYKLMAKLQFKKALSPQTPIMPVLEEDDLL
ncbi:murein biosynthesis integral membrane protein MurJ [Patescibacteria group bacterium]|nr:murein biosynthesis integral membrane protein MurJ [Patescibacteria group bacterium]MBU1970257.1 murein biosynthesis integral membrane protein MurJ [Patescibacteria group bacterium]